MKVLETIQYSPWRGNLPAGPKGREGRQRGNLFFPPGTVSLVPLCLNFSQWARFWQAGVKLPILSGDALLTAAHMSSLVGRLGCLSEGPSGCFK